MPHESEQGEAYESAKVIPNLRDVRIQANSSRVSVQCIPVLVDLVIEHTNRAPEGWVLSIAIDSLLVCLIRFGILLLRHVASAKQVPTLSILVVCIMSVFSR